GALIGPRAGVSLLLGGLVGWLGLAPGLRAADYEGRVGWLVWPGVALIAAGGLAALAFEARAFGRAVRNLFGAARAGGVAMLASAVVVVLLAWRVFGMSPGLALLGMLLAIVLSTVCARAVGETAMASYGPMGQVAQLILGLAAGAPAIADVVGAS